MKFRKNFFSVLALLALGWIIYGWSVSGQAYTQTVAGQTDTAFRAGASIGAGLGLTFFLCSGGFFFVAFALLAWRNAAGLRTEKRHQELLDAQKGKAV